MNSNTPAGQQPAPAAKRSGRRRRVLAVLAATGLAATGVPAASAGATSAGATSAGAVSVDDSGRAAAAVLIPACVDFFPIPDNTPMGTDFLRSTFSFRSLAVPGGGIVPFVNEGLDMLGVPVHGLQFANAGLSVKPLAPADTVEITIAVFHPPQVGIRAFNAAGVLVDTASVPADNIKHTVTLDAGQDITRLRFTGGGEEALIEEICTD